MFDEVQRVRNENNRLNEELEDLHAATDVNQAELDRLRKEVQYECSFWKKTENCL